MPQLSQSITRRRTGCSPGTPKCRRPLRTPVRKSARSCRNLQYGESVAKVPGLNGTNVPKVRFTMMISNHQNIMSLMFGLVLPDHSHGAYWTNRQRNAIRYVVSI